MKRRRPAGWVVAAAGGVYLFLHLPIVMLMLFSFNTSRFGARWTGFTLDWYRRLFERDDILLGLRRSLVVGVATAVIATALGTLIAVGLGRRRFRGRRAVTAFLYMPIVTPEIVVGISLLILFAFLGVPLGLGTITIAHIAFGVAFVAVVVRARLEGIDGSLEEAALTLGADELTVFRKITLPLLAPGIVAGALLAFTLSFDDYVITSFVAGAGSSTLPLVVYSMVRRGIEPSVNAISTIVIVVTAAMLLVAERLTRK